MTEDRSQFVANARCRLVLLLLLVGMGSLLVRAFYLQHYEREFLQRQGDARHLRVVSIPAYRGMILARNGEALAISTPVDSIWANPQEAMLARERLAGLAELLELDKDALYRRMSDRAGREFVYLKRHVNPQLAKQVMALKVPGINLQREYHRYYPLGEVAAHILGFTNIDDRGQEGIELAFDDWLAGRSGAKRVVRDRLGRIVDDVERLRAPRPGKDLRLSLDRRVQYLAYRELKAAVRAHGAESGSVIVLEPASGQVLAMVNQPAFNPNSRRGLNARLTRNRAVTDVFEPGSTIKPFTIAAALESGHFRPSSVVHTAPGWYVLWGHTIQDERNYGSISVSKVISKSSNVGASKIALQIPSKWLWNIFRRVGLSEITGCGFPGESAGLLTHPNRWRELERATLAFGYGLSVTPLQLAQAYAVLANDGLLANITFLETLERSQRVLSAATAQELRRMLEVVVSAQGTGELASVRGYRVAGKTGTVHKSTGGGYAENRYISVFAGMAPASKPRVVIVVIINEPSKGEYFGGAVAAPVFAKIMAGTLRLLDVPPDGLPVIRHVHKIEGADSV